MAGFDFIGVNRFVGAPSAQLGAPRSKMRSDLKSLHYLSINFFAIVFDLKQRGCSDLSRQPFSVFRAKHGNKEKQRCLQTKDG